MVLTDRLKLSVGVHNISSVAISVSISVLIPKEMLPLVMSVGGSVFLVMVIVETKTKHKKMVR